MSEYPINYMHHEVAAEISWEKSQDKVSPVIYEGAEVYFKKTPDLAESFKAKEPTLACIDERVGGEKFGVPGSGILMDRAAALKLIKDQGIKKISSHKNCGAAKLAFGKEFPAAKPTQAEIDKYADSWTSALAVEAGIEYAGQVEVEGGDQHVARVIYYDGTKRFNPSASTDFPPGFLITRYDEVLNETKSGLALAVAIAFGDHGYGKLFTKESPLVIIPVGDHVSMSDLRQEIDEALSGLKPEDKERIKIDGGLSVPDSF